VRSTVVIVGKELPGKDSNLDKEYQKLNTPKRKHKPENILRITPTAGCSTGCSNEQSEGGISDPELAALVAAWPTLSAPIRAAVRALLASATGAG